MKENKFMSGFEIYGIQNVSFVDLKIGKKINIVQPIPQSGQMRTLESLSRKMMLSSKIRLESANSYGKCIRFCMEPMQI